MTESDLFSCSDVLAKENKTVLQHSLEAVEILSRFTAFRDAQLKILASQVGITYDEIVARLFATVFLHDIGKSSRDFQEHIRGKGTGIPHALLSLPFLLAIPPLILDGGQKFRPEAFAVMSHHTPFYDNLYSKYVINHLSARYHQPCANVIFENLPEYFKQIMHIDFPLRLSTPELGCSSQSILEEMIGLVNYYPPAIIRHIHSTFEASLHFCDWLSSGGDSKFQFSVSKGNVHVLTGLERKNSSNFYEFQVKSQKVSDNLVLSAPTGKGKTEASLLWATNNESNRLLYLLPNRVSTNAMYFRISSLFPGNVGLAHGTSALVIGEQESWVREKVSLEILKSSAFMRPITVATVDQLLFSLFNWRQWEMILHNSKGSSIVFDEIHAFDPLTLSLVLFTCQEIMMYKSRFAFLSATLPKYIEKLLKRFLGNSITTVRDSAFVTEKRHCVRYNGGRVQSIIQDIVSSYEKKQSVLIVLNTVSQAKAAYAELLGRIPKEDIVLYHSRFIEKDRRLKEKSIIEGQSKKGFVAVATQVVEVSLDIDYDILFTQVTPIDDLAQRLGRVNRKGQKSAGLGNVIVSDYGENDHLIYGADNLDRAKEIIQGQMNGKLIDQKLVMELVEQQYPASEKVREVLEEFEMVSANLRELRNNLWQIQSLQLQDRAKDLYRFAKTRNQTLPEIEAIPSQFRDEVVALDNKLKSLGYYVKLPILSYSNSIYADESLNGMIFANISYSSEIGIGPPNTSGFIL